MKKKWSLLLLLGAHFCCMAQTGPVDLTNQDAATMAAGLHYKKASFFKRILFGKNYRAEWATPVTLPLFHLREMGFTIKELGGGQQTKSLRLLDKTGHEWALRTIDKDVEKALPPTLRHTLAQTVTQDMVSAAHPYAPLVVAPLAKATGVIEAEPTFFIVPDDPALGKYNSLFKNTICLLEDRNPTPDHSDTKSTADIAPALFKNGAPQLKGEAVLRARLLDMLTGDWDRHQKQWAWGFEKVDGMDYVYAIPKDRDQALFYSRGLVVKLARAVALKHLVGFAKNTAKLKKLNSKGWNFDRMFLAALSSADWNNIVQQFTTALPDSIIHAAVKTLPPEVYPLHGAQIEKKLMARRNGLQKDALRYYRFIASSVVVAGTDDADRFIISTWKDSIQVQRFTGAGFAHLAFSRTFRGRETYEVTLLGLDGADEFIQQANKASRIHLTIDGGNGANKYSVKKNRKVTVYDSEMKATSYMDVVKKELRIKE